MSNGLSISYISFNSVRYLFQKVFGELDENEMKFILLFQLYFTNYVLPQTIGK